MLLYVSFSFFHLENVYIKVHFILKWIEERKERNAKKNMHEKKGTDVIEEKRRWKQILMEMG